MAVSSAGFKQKCPTCETMVLVKDMRQVGKKIECPKCKDRFVVEEPDDDDAAAQETAITAKADGKAKANGKAAPAGKPKVKRFREDDVDDEDARDDADDGADEDEGKGSKKAGGSSKMLPMVLAGVGVVVLIVAAVLILVMNRSPSTNAPAPNPNVNAPNANVPVPKPGDNQPEKKEDTQPVVDKGLPVAGAELTNLLPNDTEHVLYVNFREVLDISNPYRELIFGAGALPDGELAKRLGFSPAAIDTLIRADRYTAGGWSYTVIHLTEAIDQKALAEALNLQPVAPINNQPFFQASRANPWFDEMSRLSLGVDSKLRSLAARLERPFFVRVHNPQTLIVGDEAPIVALLKADSQFKLLTDLGPAPNAGQNPGNPMGPMGPAFMPMTPNMPNMPMPNSPPAGKPAGSPAPAGRGAPPPSGNSSGIEDGPGFGEPQTAQVAPTIIAPPVNLQGGGGGAQMPGGFKGPPMGQGMPGMSGMPGMQPGGPNMAAAAQGGLVRSETWLTIDPSLKAILDRLQFRAQDSKDKMFYASATDMNSAHLDTSKIPEFKDRVLWHPRQLWDITQLLEERKQRIKAMGTALMQRDARHFQYRAELICTQDADAKELRKELVEKAAPQVARTIDRLLNHSVEIPKIDAPKTTTQPGVPGPGFGSFPPGGMPAFSPMPMGPMGIQEPMGPAFNPDQGNPMGPMGPPAGFPGSFPGGFNPQGQPKEELAKSSKLTFTVRNHSVEMKLDLVLDPQSNLKLNSLVAGLAMVLKSEIDLATGPSTRHDLAWAGKLLGEKGATERGFGPGRYPPAAFKRGGATRFEQQPYHRMSWMTTLLPHLGHDALYQKIDFEASWQDPKNWMAALTIVPQFLDPQYPLHTRVTSVPDVGVEMAATHVVGIAGVGLDAADYSRSDPAFAGKRGVFGYDGSASIDEIRAGRGLSNTAVMIQIPHDGPTGVSPWIAGGGATVRGVPEKDSIKPFVLTTDKNGKPIQFNGKRGTYVSMADGSTRFVSANVSDEVFKAMCTVQGPAPANFDLFKNDDTLIVPKQQVAKVETKPASGGNAAGLSPEGKAFHDGVVKTVNSLKALENEGAQTAAKAAADPAKLETEFNKLADRERAMLREARQLKAPAGKEGQDYYAAFKAFLDFNEQALDTDLKVLLDALRTKSPESQAKLVKLAQEKIPQEQALMTRLEAAQRAFLNTGQVPAASPPVSAPPPKVAVQAPNVSPAKGTPAGWISFNVPGGGYSVSLPGQPLTLDQQPKGLPKFKLYVAADPTTKNAYSAVAIPMDQKAKAEYAQNPDQSFVQMGLSMSGASGQNVQPRVVTIGGHQGREFTFREPKSGKQIFLQVFVINDHYAMVMATGDQPTPTPEVQAFFASVKAGN